MEEGSARPCMSREGCTYLLSTPHARSGKATPSAPSVSHIATTVRSVFLIPKHAMERRGARSMAKEPAHSSWGRSRECGVFVVLRYNPTSAAVFSRTRESPQMERWTRSKPLYPV